MEGAGSLQAALEDEDEAVREAAAKAGSVRGCRHIQT
jgi:hypothetical protein